MPRPKRSHGQGSKVRKRKDGRYGASLMAHGRRVYVYGRTAGDCAARLKALRSAAERGEPLQQPRTTVGEYLVEWLAGVTPTVAPQTAERYRRAVDGQLVPQLGELRLRDLAAADVRRCYAALAERLAAATVGHCGAVLRMALAAAVRDGLIGQNVAAHVVPPREPPRERPTLSRAAAERFFAAAAGEPLSPLFALLLGSALRLGEALALSWQDVDQVRGAITVRRHLVRVGNEIRIVPSTKTRRLRTVPLTALARAALERQRGEPASPPEALVFPAAGGGPLHPQHVRWHFGKTLRAAGLPHMRPHDLRHSVASLLGAEGLSPRAVADLLGHRGVAITLQTYTHGDELARGAAAALDRLLPEGLLDHPPGGLGSVLGSDG